MMLAWTFAARTLDEVAALVRALGKHRYVREVDHRLHWTVDEALAFDPRFAAHAEAFRARRRREPGLDLDTRDPSLWRAATADDVLAALSLFWTPGEPREQARRGLAAALAETGLPPATHAPFSSDPDDPPHPELVLLDWVLHPIVDLNVERHAGALHALEEAREECNPSAPVFQEGPCLAAPELLLGAPSGVLVEDFHVWSDGAVAYADYVFRGASRIAKLGLPPEPP